VKDDHCASDLTVPIVNRSCGVLDRGFVAVASNQQAVRAESDRGVLPHGQCQRIQCGFPALRVDDPYDVLQWHASGLGPGPTGHFLGNRIEVGDVACHIGTDHGIADRVERDPGLLGVPQQ